MNFKFKIVTPERLLYSGEVTQVTLPTTSGEVTILPNHIPLISEIAPGEIRITASHENAVISVDGGFLEVMPQGVVVLADAANRVEELDAQALEQAVKRAEEALKTIPVMDQSYAVLKARLDREMSRLHIARKYHRKNVNPVSQNN